MDSGDSGKRTETRRIKVMVVFGTRPEATRLLQDREAYPMMARRVNLYGDGKGSSRLLYVFGLAESRPDDFQPFNNL